MGIMRGHWMWTVFLKWVNAFLHIMGKPICVCNILYWVMHHPGGGYSNPTSISLGLVVKKAKIWNVYSITYIVLYHCSISSSWSERTLLHWKLPLSHAVSKTSASRTSLVLYFKLFFSSHAVSPPPKFLFFVASSP